MKSWPHGSNSKNVSDAELEPAASWDSREAIPARPVLRVAPPARERRGAARPGENSLRVGLTAQQLNTLATLEQFHWTLRFVRRPMFQAAVPIVFSPDGGRFVVLEPDGTINESPGFKIRP